MGTTLANIHILDGDDEIICALLPDAVVCRWSSRFISAYSQEFAPGLIEKTAKDLSRKVTQPILSAWLFDSDAAGFTVYQNGKVVAEHIMNPDGYCKMGNASLFCEALGLSAEDVPRLRFIWKKGDAEEQVDLTASLLGVPLYNDHIMLPDKQHSRDVDIVDKWISERPAPPKIKNETKAILLQELTHFRWNQIISGALYCSFEPYDYEYRSDEIQFWIPDMDGMLRSGWSTEENLDLYRSHDRVLVMDYSEGVITYDSAGLLPKGYKLKYPQAQPYFLSDGGLLWHGRLDSSECTGSTFIRCASNGSEMWHKKGIYREYEILTGENSEIIFPSESRTSRWLERVDTLTGATIERIPHPFGINVYGKKYHNGFWWIAHDGITLNEGKWNKPVYTLAKYDNAFRTVAELSLPSFTQEIFFSQDDTRIYLFFYKNQVMVINPDSLVIENILNDKSFLYPLSFDISGRFWLQRDRSTIEAWDANLSKPLSRHSLKGVIIGYHKTAQGGICIVTWNEKEKVVRVYRLE